MARLRAPDGCPWDRAQDARSLRTYLLEETYEVLDAIEDNDTEALREELGDLLLQVVFHAGLASELGQFSIDDVLTDLHDKLVRRHPHVFGSTDAESPEQVKANWEALKTAEKREKRGGTEAASALDGVSRHQPAVIEAYQLSRKASQVGFDWKKPEDVIEKLREELQELEGAVQQADDGHKEEEAGDLLFAAVNLARFVGVDPEAALRRANRKFVTRFQSVESELRRRGTSPEDATLEEMDEIWNRVKESR